METQTVVVFGQAGSGRSSALNCLGNRALFEVGEGMGEMTKVTQQIEISDNQHNWKLIDTPAGFLIKQGKKDLNILLRSRKQDKKVFILYCFPCTNIRLDESIQNDLEKLKTLGSEYFSRTAICLTMINQLNDRVKDKLCNRAMTQLRPMLKKKGFGGLFPEIFQMDLSTKETSQTTSERIKFAIMKQKKESWWKYYLCWWRV